MRQVGDVTVLDLGVRDDLGLSLTFGGETADSLRVVIRDFAARGQTKILLNLQELRYIDSSGMGDLFSSTNALRRQGGDLKVVNPSIGVQKLLRMTGLDTMVEVKPDETSALEAFSRM